MSLAIRRLRSSKLFKKRIRELLNKSVIESKHGREKTNVRTKSNLLTPSIMD